MYNQDFQQFMLTGEVEEKKKNKVSIAKFSLQLVKESNAKYELESNKINAPVDASDLIREVFQMDKQCEEILALICLDTKNKVIGCFEVSRGTLNSGLIHPREIFKRAIVQNSASIIIGHNHPSGDPSPSNEDINITNRLKEVGKIVGIELLDHVIIGEKSYISLKEKGIL